MSVMVLRASLTLNAGRTPPSPPIRSPDTDPSRGQPATAAGNLNRPILSKMALNTSYGTAASAIWKITYRALEMTLAPSLDQLFPQRCQCPVAHCLGRPESTYE